MSKPTNLRHPDNVDMQIDWAETDGFQMPSRKRSIEEWRRKKEDKEFKKLCRRLYGRNHARERWKKDPEAMRENCRRWRKNNPDKVQESAEKTKAKRKVARRKTLTCEECGKVWEQQRYARFCRTKCRNRHNGRRRTAEGYRNKGILNMKLAPTVMRILRKEPWLELNEIYARTTDVKRGSLAIKLTDWIQKGVLIHDGRKKWRRYAIAGTRQVQA